MQAIQIINYLRQQELTVTLTDDDYIELSPVGKISDKLIERLRKHKPSIIEELRREQHQKIEIIRQWLFKINEPEEFHYLVIDKCKAHPEALAYFLKHTCGEFKVKDSFEKNESLNATELQMVCF